MKKIIVFLIIFLCFGVVKALEEPKIEMEYVGPSEVFNREPLIFYLKINQISDSPITQSNLVIETPLYMTERLVKLQKGYLNINTSLLSDSLKEGENTITFKLHVYKPDGTYYEFKEDIVVVKKINNPFVYIITKIREFFVWIVVTLS